MFDILPQALIEGFLLGISLIAAIGAQNLFVIRQGIKGEHVMTTATVSSLCDLVMIGIGSLGVGSLIDTVPGLRKFAVIGGIGFLLFYALKSCLNILQGKSLALVLATDGERTPRSKVILSAMGFSLLNPHAVLDAVVLIGGLSAQYDIIQERAIFASGAGLASIVWFFVLGYGAKLLGPLFRKPLFATLLDVLVAGIMFGIAWSLAKAELFSL